MQYKDIQKIPVTDSPNNDAFEALVELYYQSQGYITSAGKWFWVWENGKKQRGYQDIDVLAVNAHEIIIISVTSNLDDKLNFNRLGQVNEEKLNNLTGYFNRVFDYLNEVESYRWLVNKDIRKVVAYNHAFKRSEVAIKNCLDRDGIQTIGSDKILSTLEQYLCNSNIKIQDLILRALQVQKFNKDKKK
ncbi:MAG: hypothetical protein C0602_05915 [Denitrovibrio sp.]|nr:MAG: hypothetical protein C0602_05915 [Denitrovibrio sp.]